MTFQIACHLLDDAFTYMSDALLVHSPISYHLSLKDAVCKQALILLYYLGKMKSACINLADYMTPHNIKALICYYIFANKAYIFFQQGIRYHKHFLDSIIANNNCLQRNNRRNPTTVSILIFLVEFEL